MVFENRVLRRKFGPKWGEVKCEWRELYNEELNDLYSSSNSIRMIKPRIRWAGHVARMTERRQTYRILVVTTEGSTRRRWEDNI